MLNRKTKNKFVNRKMFGRPSIKITNKKEQICLQKIIYYSHGPIILNIVFYEYFEHVFNLNIFK